MLCKYEPNRAAKMFVAYFVLKKSQNTKAKQECTHAKSNIFNLCKCNGFLNSTIKSIVKLRLHTAEESM